LAGPVRTKARNPDGGEWPTGRPTIHTARGAAGKGKLARDELSGALNPDSTEKASALRLAAANLVMENEAPSERLTALRSYPPESA